MPVLNHIPPEVLKREFVYRGWMFGLVPVYVGELRPGVNISTRNGVPEFLLDAAEALFAGFCFVATALVQDFEPSYPIAITGRLDGQPIAENEL